LLTDKDSGRPSAPLLIVAPKDNHVIITSADDLGEWIPTGDHLETKVAARVAIPTQFFVGDQRRYRPRYPESGYRTVLTPQIPPTANASGFSSMQLEEADVSEDFSETKGAELVVFHHWTTSRLPLTSFDRGLLRLTSSGHTYSTSRDASFFLGARFFIDNIPRTWMKEGEWRFLPNRATIAYKPVANEPIGQTHFPTLEVLMQTKGVEYVTISNVEFSRTAWDEPAEGHSEPQAEVKLPAAILVEDSRHLKFDNVTVAHTGGHAMKIGGLSSDIDLERLTLNDLGGGGLYIGETDGNRTAVSNVRVSNCLINGVGITHFGSVAVWIANASYVVVQNCEIADTRYSGISVGWRWGYGRSFTSNITIEGNFLHDIGNGILSDMGGIYFLGDLKGSIIRDNLIQDVNAWDYGGWGLYADEGTSNIELLRNIVRRTTSASFFLHYGQNVDLIGNFFYAASGSTIRCGSRDRPSNMRLQHNTILYKSTPFQSVCQSLEAYPSDNRILPEDDKNISFMQNQAQEFIKTFRVTHRNLHRAG
jgi:hypothetical protein